MEEASDAPAPAPAEAAPTPAPAETAVAAPAPAEAVTLPSAQGMGAGAALWHDEAENTREAARHLRVDEPTCASPASAIRRRQKIYVDRQFFASYEDQVTARRGAQVPSRAVTETCPRRR